MNHSLQTAAYAVLIAFAASTILCPILIPYLAKLKYGQRVRDDGPASHLKKAGTPTMGGIMIIVSFLLASAFFLSGNSEGMALVLLTTGFCVIGFLDDWIKIHKKRSLGLRAYQKIIMQIAVSAAFIWFWGQQASFSTVLTVPFFTDISFDLGWLYAPAMVVVLLGTVNGANLTDGLDGMAAGVTSLIAVFFLFAAWAHHSPILPLAGAAVGSLLGFLLFNAHPARVFMGDTGSLALGGLVAGMAIMLRMPLFILIVALIYVVESLSVLIQVGWYKLTKKRIFKMAPIHHSFEMSGWPETKIVAYSYVITAIMCLIGYLGGR